MTDDYWNIYDHRERVTLDAEWTQEELESDIYDVCAEIMSTEVKKYEHRALYDRDLLKCQYMTEHLINTIGDVIELYNKEYDKHRDSKIFGIRLFDDAIKKMIRLELKRNVVV